MTAASDHSETLDADEADSVSQLVVTKVAEATGTDPLELEPLYHTVDPDCLDSIFAGNADESGRTEGAVQFSMAGCEVVVGADGSVEVTRAAEESDALAPEHEPSSAPGVPESPD